MTAIRVMMMRMRMLMTDQIAGIKQQLFIVLNCRYGMDCFRKNPQHFEEFKHV